MSTVFRPRQRAEAFAARVDGSPAIRAVPGRADVELERLVGVATSLQAFADQPEQAALVTPRVDFVLDLRERLMTEAAVVLTAENAALRLPQRQRGTRERKLVAVASVAVLLGGTVGVAAAAQNSLPGEALYPIKRGIENAQASLSTSSAGKGRDLLGAATDRLDEVQGLLAQRSATEAPQIPATLDEFSAQARQGSGLLMSSYRDNRDPATIAAVRQFAADGLSALETMSVSAPPVARDELTQAATTLRDIDRQASGLCDTCSTLPPLKVPSMLLVSADAERALRQAGASKGLDNSHPVTVPKAAVRRASGSGEADPVPSAGGTTGTGGSSTDTQQSPAPAAPSKSAPIRVKLKLGDKTIDTNDGLDQTVKTLLPDPGDGLLP